MNTEDSFFEDGDLDRKPRELGRFFGNQDEAAFWSYRLTTSGYPAKRQGRCVWFSTDQLQTAAVEMASRFGFQEFAES